MRLGYINSNRIQRLIKGGLLEPLDIDGFPVCESCLEGKMTKSPFNAKGRRPQELKELVHLDICGLMSIQARGGYEYIITFTDENMLGCKTLRCKNTATSSRMMN